MRAHLARATATLLAASGIALLPAHAAQADRIRNDQWHLRYLRVAEAHKISQGDGVTVAVIDTGVDPHPDLRNNLLPGTDVIPGGKGDGRRDRDSHGTSMAGLIAAHGQGSTNGALGIAPKAKILPIFSMPPEGQGDADKLAEGIEWATAKGADIISVSSVSGPTMRLQSAVQQALTADIVVVAGADSHTCRLIAGTCTDCRHRRRRKCRQ